MPGSPNSACSAAVSRIGIFDRHRQRVELVDQRSDTGSTSASACAQQHQLEHRDLASAQRLCWLIQPSR